MMEPLILIGVIFVLMLVVVVFTNMRQENDIHALKKEVKSLQSDLQSRAGDAPSVRCSPDELEKLGHRIKEFDIKLELLRNQFLKILAPIHQNAEDINELDDDLARLQARYEELCEELKNREESPPPVAA